MNPSAPGNLPPPPGIDMDEESKTSTVSSKSAPNSTIDQIDPYIKNPEYIKYKSNLNRESARHRRSRSRSHERYRSRSRDRKHKRRSRSRDRRRRSRSRSRGRRYRRYSHSSSRSRSSSYERSSRTKHKKKRSRRYSRSRSRSHSNRYRSERKRSKRTKSRSESPSDLNESFVESTDKGEEEDDPSKENAFKNDGTFLETFKKMQEEKEKEEAAKAAASTSEGPKKPLPAYGKRRGGRVLKTGIVIKTKSQEEEDLENAQDPWSIYLKEVKKYKEACCDDDSKTRPLVK